MILRRGGQSRKVKVMPRAPLAWKEKRNAEGFPAWVGKKINMPVGVSKNEENSLCEIQGISGRPFVK